MYRIVVIDDEYIVVEGIKAMIARLRLDYEVVAGAYDGLSGLETIRRYKPDMVITDIRMPGMDGLSIIEEAKEQYPEMAFVVISGYTEFEYAQQALRLGVIGYIDKPISLDKLRSVLEKASRDFYAQKEHFREVVASKESLQSLNPQLGSCIDAMIARDVKKFSTHMEHLLDLIAASYETEEDFRREVYKCMSVLSDIMREQYVNMRPEDGISYREISRLQGREIIYAYAIERGAIFQKYMEADKTGSRHRVITDVLAYIEKNYQSDIGLNELAERVSMSVAYLSVLFKNEVGMSFIKYLTKVRIDHAKKLLAQGMKVYEVSEQVGYHNYRYFTDAFKKSEGMTPQKYKDRI